MEERSVIVILTDSMRVDHLGCYGNPWIRTPNIDRLASEGMVFDCAFSEGLPTLPVRTALFTGRYTLPFRGWQRLEPGDVLLSEALWSRQCNSAIVSDGYHLHEPPHNDYGRGFRHVHWIRGQEHDPYIVDPEVEVHPEEYYPSWERSAYVKGRHHLFEQYLRNTAHWRDNGDTFVAQTVRAGMRWLEDYSREGRFLLWLDCFDPHAPYDPRFPPYGGMYGSWEEGVLWIEGEVGDYPEDVVRQARANYAGEVSLVDEWVGTFMEKVEDLGILDETLIIYLSDHGEPLGEHGIITKARPLPYEELCHIPLVIRHPDGEGRGRRSSAFVQTPDVMPTILDFLGVEAPKTVQGRTLLPLVRGEEEGLRDFAVAGHYRRTWSIRDREWSLYLWLSERHTLKTGPELYRRRGIITTPRPGQYSSERDVYEQDNVMAEEPEVARRMERQLREFLNSLST